MIKKQELLTSLRENLDKEEKGIPLYTLHLSNALFLSGARPEDQVRIKEILMTLKKDSERHKQMYEAMIDKVKGESQDVY